jgi:hypothetical protein
MDTLVMHRTSTEAGMPSGQADAVIRVVKGGMVIKQDLDVTAAGLRHDLELSATGIKRDLEVTAAGLRHDLDLSTTGIKQDLEITSAGIRHELSVAVVKIESRIERLENKLNLLFGVAILAVLAPAVTRLIVGS